MNNHDIDQLLAEFGEDRDFAREARVWRENPRQSIKRPEDFIDGLMTIVEGRADGMPFALGKELRFRAGEVTIWAGENGVGKSLITGELALQLIMQKQRTLVMSFEMSPAMTLYRMLRQCYGRKPKLEEERAIDAWLRYLGDSGMLLTNVRSELTADIVIGIVKVASAEFQCRHIVIDNLMKVVAGEDDLNAQKAFITECCRLAQEFQCHIHIVAHMKKPDSKVTMEPTRYFIRGSSAISDQADNVVLVWRNKAKDALRDDKGAIDAVQDIDQPDTYIRVDKQRNGEWTGKIGLWYDPASMALCTGPERVPPQLCPAELIPGESCGEAAL